MTSFPLLAVVLLSVASITWGERLGTVQYADAETIYYLDKSRRDAHNPLKIADAGNGSLPVPFGAATEGNALPEGVSLNGLLMVDIATGGQLPVHLAAQVAAAFNDTAGAMMATLDATEWMAATGAPINTLVYKVIFAVNAGRLFSFTQHTESSALDSERLWSNWRQAEATPVFDADGTAIGFEASAEPRFPLGWKFSPRPSPPRRLEIQLSGHPFPIVTLHKVVGRLPFTNNLPMSVDAGKESTPLRSAAVEALPRAVSVNGMKMLKIATDSQLPEKMLNKAGLFNASASALIAQLDGTVWTALGRGCDTIKALIFNVTFAISAGRLLCFTRYRASSMVDGEWGEWGWSNWSQAEARPVFGAYGGITFRASAEPGLTVVAFKGTEYQTWYPPGWSFLLLPTENKPLRLEIRLFGYTLRYVTRTYFDLGPPLENNLPLSVDAGDGFLPVSTGAAAAEDQLLPRGVSADGVRIVQMAIRSRLPQDILPKVAANINDTAGALMAELDRTMWTAAGRGPIKSFIFNFTFAVRAGRLFCFTRFKDIVDGAGNWSNWRQAEARPVFDNDRIAIAFDASADPWFYPGWRFSMSRPQGLLSIQLFGISLRHLQQTQLSADPP